MQSWQHSIAYKKNGRLPPGMLFTGPEGIGKLAFAKEYAQFILCTSNDENVCKQCRACILFGAGNHPDYFLIEGEEKNAAIKIDQIRNLIESLAQTPLLSDFQVGIISLAENMNKAAANALLKTLEEPRGNVVLLLLSNKPSAIPATIRSRCQNIKLPLPSKAEAEQWLASQVESKILIQRCLSLADNLPLKALAYANTGQDQVGETLITYLKQIQSGEVDPIKIAAECTALTENALQFLITFIADMIRIKFSAKAFLNHHDKISSLTELGNKISIKRLFHFLEKILEANKLLSNRNNVNLQLLMEKIFINWRYINEIS